MISSGWLPDDDVLYEFTDPTTGRSYVVIPRLRMGPFSEDPTTIRTVRDRMAE